MYSGTRLLCSFYVILLFLVIDLHTCSARGNYNHCTSSCGNIHNISYPFRLKTDPRSCGHRRYELTCEDNHTVFYWDSRGYKYERIRVKYFVKAINYNNFTIRLVHADVQKDNCSLVPTHALLVGDSLSYADNEVTAVSAFVDIEVTNKPYYYFGEYPFTSYRWNGSGFSKLYQSFVFMSCTRPVTCPLYLETSCQNGRYVSNSSKGNSCVMVDATAVSAFVDSCLIELVAVTSLLFQVRNISFADVHNGMVFGFELSWFFFNCCEHAKGHSCNLDDSHKVRCSSFYSFWEEIWWMALTVFLYSIHALVLWRIALCFCGAPCTCIFLIYKLRRRHLSMYDGIEEFLQTQDELMPISYSYSEIKKITRGFKDKLGEGGYGTVYKGKLRSGRLVAVKMLGKSKANGQEFINEVATIGRVHHVNIVRLLGFCAKGQKRALVYEFMPNGSLDKHIFSTQGSENPISNRKMCDIAIGIARGIEYLHQGCDMQILHFDIKPHNILLDENFVPKVSDFGLAKLYPTDNSIVSLTAARGTMGYMAPELFYKNIGGISYRADVYSFGMLLMEMAGRRKNLNANEEQLSQIYFPSWVYDQVSQGRDLELEEGTEDEKNMLKKMIMTALWCIQFNPSDRPSMHKVVEMLEGEAESIEMPPKPFVLPQEMKPQEGDGVHNTTLPQSREEQSDCTTSVNLVVDSE